MSEKMFNYYRIEKAIRYLTEHFKSQPDFSEVAREVNMSPFHFHRVFKEWVGISPKKFLQYLTVDFLKEKIHETGNMMDAADLAGLSSQSRVHDLFVSIEGVSPHHYKLSGEGLEIFYGYHATPFGMCFIAVTTKGICCLKFIDEEKTRDEFAVFAARWSFGKVHHRPEITQPYIRKIFAPDKINPGKLSLLVQGTPFQVKVWEALVNIPFGSVASYQQIAHLIGQPHSERAVGAAVAANSLLYLIPCHRIITKGGQMGNYHYGKARKQAMLGWEISRGRRKQGSGIGDWGIRD